ncbi:YigZ family protein [Bowmanella pacifica]|uniref:YigZ family protein n=1 Tax=Bowmanella pacifica TaxID=502051 RepID=A0A917YYF0_9ALTE|nr:YigZ family protein [Bowmanella pacifica]GGO67928.1 YigZ family protein [Bowmanella pacifica]
MSRRFPVPAAPHQFEFEIKRSRFLSLVERAVDREAAEAFIRKQRLAHPQAAHVCWAYIAGSPDTTVRSMSDDGEPSGTAGRPMLKVLEHSGIGEIVVAVVRYYGGIKLGTGGLQRAYSDAVTGALKELPTDLWVPRSQLTIEFDYAQESNVRHCLGQFDTDEPKIDYANQVCIHFAIADSQKQQCLQALTDLCAGAIQISEANKN